MTEESNIRAFPGAEIPEQPICLERQPFNFCRHDKITLDEHSRTVRCAACGKVFDPFQFLQSEVSRLQDAWTSHKQVRAILREHLDRVEALKKEEARLKGRIKTLKAKVEPVINYRNREL